MNCIWFLFHQVLRQLQQGLAKCYSVAFEKSGAVSDAKITPHTLNFVKKLVSTFGVGLENVSNVSTMFSSAASESLARRAQATAQDPVFQKLKGQFTTGESDLVPSAVGKFALTLFPQSLTYTVTVFVYFLTTFLSKLVILCLDSDHKETMRVASLGLGLPVLSSRRVKVWTQSARLYCRVWK